jgi:cytochrome P450
MVADFLWTDRRFAATAASVLVGCVYLYSTSYHKKKKLPPLPPPGVSFSEFLDASLTGKIASKQSEWLEKYGPVFTIPSPMSWILPNQVFVADPVLVKELTVKQANMYREPSRFSTRAPNLAEAIRNTVGVGVTGLLGEEWKWRKEALIKEFRKKRMLDNDRGLVETLVKEGKQLCDQLDEACRSGQPVKVDVLTTRAAASVVLYFLFGRELSFNAEALRDSAKDLMDCLMFALTTPGYGFLKRIPGTLSYQKEQQKFQAWKVVDDVVAGEIDMLLQENDGSRSVHPDRSPGSVIASLIANEERFKQGGVPSMIAEARVFVQAGFETTAHALAFSFGMMAERPDLATSMALQGRKALTDMTPASIQSALEETDLIKNFFLESIRLFPLAPALGGICTQDITIESNGSSYGLPKGTGVFFPNIVLQRNKLHSGQGKDPNVVDPDRWNAPPSGQPFLHTFNSGPVRCV